MFITHEEAHKLVQLNMEHMLNRQDAAKLSAHLRDCRACSAYASETREVTDLLVPIMKRQWSVQSAPLSIPALLGRSEKIKSSTFLTMRTAAIGLMFVTLFFSAWQFVISSVPGSNQIPLASAPIPTPSVLNSQSTSTESTRDACEMLLYPVQTADTLASIAEQFSTSEDELRGLNQLKTEALSPPMELLIPICNFTPTGTISPAMFTTTYTPLINTTTSTPGG